MQQIWLPSVLWHCWLGGRNGIRLVTNMGVQWRWALVSPDGVAPSRMVSVSTSVNLPLHHKVQRFSAGTGSPGWSRKKGCRTVVVVVVVWWVPVVDCNRQCDSCLFPSRYCVSVQAAALVHIYLDGSVLVSHGGVESGQGLHTKVIQVGRLFHLLPCLSLHLRCSGGQLLPLFCAYVLRVNDSFSMRVSHSYECSMTMIHA